MAERSSAPEDSHASPGALSERAQALRQVVGEVLADYGPEMGATLDVPAVTVKSQHILDVCRVVKEAPNLSFKMLLCLAGVDYQEHCEIVYVLLSLEEERKLIIKTQVPYDTPNLPSVVSVWRGAEWYEREAHDLFGVVFDGHPDLRPLILYEGYEGYPGRKEHPFHDYQEF